ncbi:MAG: sigma-54-dependent Fis family transcriptional regulator [Pirellulales bacterium]|nr:sigma-54-dependent Fis family transcriptional regulator [Pirellulales bacterium]
MNDSTPYDSYTSGWQDDCSALYSPTCSCQVQWENKVHRLISKSKAMSEVWRRIERAARVDSPVLIQGERGVGKKIIAQTIHRYSHRSDKPLVIVHTDQPREQSVEEELFGTTAHHGALTKTANSGGSLLIDEITALSLTAQAKLLIAAETKYQRQQANGAIDDTVAFRFMATTRHDLGELVEQGKFRGDLHYRFSVVTIRVPPLRERKEDIAPLAEYMLEELYAAREMPPPTIDPQLMQLLIKHPWQGNAQDLHDCLEEMVTSGESQTLQIKHLPAWLNQTACSDGNELYTEKSSESLADIERAAIIRALDTHHGNRTRAAKSLGISVRTLQRKLKQMSIL